MEGVPRIPMISFPLRKSADTPNFKHALLKYIAVHYDENAESYKKEIHELESLRNSAIHVTKDLAGCATLKKYACQLNYMKARFPLNEDSPIAISFSWYDAYTEQVHGWSDIDYEICCIIFNIGALHTDLAGADSRTSVDDMKNCVTHYQCAAWAFQYIRSNFHKFFTPDVSPDALGIMSSICLAQAQECVLEKSFIDNRKSSITAKVVVQIVDYYNLTLKSCDQMLKDSSQYSDKIIKAVKKWKKVVELKISYYKALTYLYRGQQAEDQSKWGERVTFYKAAQEQLENCLKLAKNSDKTDGVHDTLSFTTDVIVGKVTSSEKDNEFIYHEKVPAIESITDSIQGVPLVKPIQLKFDDPNISGPDIFSRLVPLEAHEASSLYSEMKADLVRTYSTKIEEKNVALDKFLIAFQLDQLDIHSNEQKVPQELVDCCAELNANKDAIKKLFDLMGQLSGKFHDVEENLKEICEIFEIQEVKEKDYSAVMWKRAPNSVLNDLRHEAEKLDKDHSSAGKSIQSLHTASEFHSKNLKTLMQPLSEIIKSLPSLPPMDERDIESIGEMKRLASKIDEMKKQRVVLEQQLRESVLKDDITKQIVVVQDESHEAVFAEELKKHDKITKVIDQNLVAQENIIRALTEANARYSSTRERALDVSFRRNKIIQELISSYESYDELLTKCQDGLEFYTKLDENVGKVLSKLKGVAKVQDEEREGKLGSMMKHLQQPPNYKNQIPPNSSPIASSNVNPNLNYGAETSTKPKVKDYLNSQGKLDMSKFPVPSPSPIAPINPYAAQPSPNANFQYIQNQPSAPTPTQSYQQTQQIQPSFQNQGQVYANTQPSLNTTNTPAQNPTNFPQQNPNLSVNPYQNPPQLSAINSSKIGPNVQPSGYSYQTPYSQQMSSYYSYNNYPTQTQLTNSGVAQPSVYRPSLGNAPQMNYANYSTGQQVATGISPSSNLNNSTSTGSQYSTNSAYGVNYGAQNSNQIPSQIPNQIPAQIPNQIQTPAPNQTYTATTPYLNQQQQQQVGSGNFNQNQRFPLQTPGYNTNNTAQQYNLNYNQTTPQQASAIYAPQNQPNYQTPQNNMQNYVPQQQQYGAGYNYPSQQPQSSLYSTAGAWNTVTNNAPNIQNPSISANQQINQNTNQFTLQNQPASTVRTNFDLLSDIDLSAPPNVAPLAPTIVHQNLNPGTNNETNPEPMGKNDKVDEVSNGVDKLIKAASNSTIAPSSPVIKLENGAHKAAKKVKVDPFSDPILLEKFAVEVEKLAHTIESFDKKSLNGPTNLDIKWREVLDLQNADSSKKSISVARCYPMKNRFPDILPYDQSRVPLPSTKDDYINASFLNKLSSYGIPLIVTQAPLPATYADFWHMIWNQNVELIACLVNDTELKGHIYWPDSKGTEANYGPFTISLQTRNVKQNFIERIFSVQNSNLKQSRVVIHLQFTEWGGNVFPPSPSPLLNFVSEVYSFYSQQRNLSRPVVLHCIAGVGRSGVFSLLSSAIQEIDAGHAILDLAVSAGSASERRKGIMIDREYLRYTYHCLLYYCQDLLMKRGILSARNVFDDKPKVSQKHTRHPSQDFLDDPIKKLLKSESPTHLNKTKEIDAVVLSREESRRSSDSSISSIKNCDSSPSSISSVKNLPQLIAELPPSLTNLDPSTFSNLKNKETTVGETKKEAFESGIGRLIEKKAEENPNDPLSSLDPLWTIKK